ncbi:MAG: LTA synthase family protein, partial [Flavobacteriales bacterium]
MNTSHLDRFTLKHYTRLMFSFFGCLVVLSIFQYTTLYFKGVVDTVFGTSFLIALVHQMGFTALVGIVLTFPFNFWENFRPRYGFVLTIVVLMLILIIEALLITYFITTLVPLGSDLLGYSFADIKMTISNSGGQSFYVVLAVVAMAGLFFGFYKITSKFYHRISKMYPFTIILFSLFVATLFTDGKPI